MMRLSYAKPLVAGGLLFLTLACVSSSPPPYRRADWPAGIDATVAMFYGRLEPHGVWLEIAPHGWVWSPSGMAIGWRPYTHGRWIHTFHGWTWVSDWAWGWAPFHYGRWDHHGLHGWVWIPGRTWAPAWLAWREGGGWIGWAPLPPGVHWRVGVGLELGGVDLGLAIGSDHWVFVDEREFLSFDLHRFVAPIGRNARLLPTARHVTRYLADGGRVIERGVAVERIERAVGRPVTTYRVQELERPRESAAGRVRDGAVRVYRPDPDRPGRRKAKDTRPPGSEGGA